MLAAAFDPILPSVTRASAHWLLGIGIALVLALLLALFFSKRPGRRFSFSLRWLMAFCLACSLIVWGVTRAHLARTQLREYYQAVRLKKELAKEVPWDDLNAEPALPLAEVVAYMNRVCGTKAALDPALANAGYGGNPIDAWTCIIYMRREHAFKWIARSAGLQCETKGDRITLVKRSAEALARDAELEKKLATVVSIDFTETPLLDVLNELQSRMKLNLVLDTANLHKDTPTTPITLRVHDIEARNAIKWAMRCADADADSLNDGDLFCELPSELRARELRQKDEIRTRLDGCKISFDFKDKPLTEAVDFIAKSANVNIIIDPKVLADRRFPITLRVNEMSAALALKWILKLAELEYDIRDQVLFASVRADA